MTSRTSFRFAAMSRRAAITGAALAAMALSACGGGGAKAPADGDMAQGAAEGAKVTVVEYASAACGACAAWHKQVYPAFKAKYIDGGQIRFVLREFPTHPEVDAAGFILGRCAAAKSGNTEDYFRVVHQMWDNHPALTPGGPQFPELLQSIRSGLGFSQEEYMSCITDADAIAGMERRASAGRDAGVSATPTFFINGTQISDRSLEGLSAAIDAELAK